MVCISPKSQGFSRIRQYRHFEAQNRGISAIGDISPAQIFHRQREAQNRGFGDISPEMATLILLLQCVYGKEGVRVVLH